MTDQVQVEQVDDPFAWTGGVSWHQHAHRAVMASVEMGKWLSAALDDPSVSDAMKADIGEWFSAGEPMEILCQTLAHFATLQRQDERVRELEAALDAVLSSCGARGKYDSLEYANAVSAAESLLKDTIHE